MEELELAREVGDLLEAQFEGDGFDRARLLQQLGRVLEALIIQPALWALAESLPGIALQLAAGNF